MNKVRDFTQTVRVNTKADMSSVVQQLNNIRSAAKSTMPDNAFRSLDAQINAVLGSLEKYRATQRTSYKNNREVDATTKAYAEYTTQVDRLVGSLKNLDKASLSLKGGSLASIFQNGAQALEAYDKALDNIAKKASTLGVQLKQGLQLDVDKLMGEIANGGSGKKTLGNLKSQNTQKLTKQQATSDALKTEYYGLEKRIQKRQELAGITDRSVAQEREYQKLLASQKEDNSRFSSTKKAFDDSNRAIKDLTQNAQKLKEIENTLNQLGNIKTPFQAINEGLKKLGIKDTVTDIQSLQRILHNLEPERVKALDTYMNQLQASVKGVSNEGEKAEKGIRELLQGADSANRLDAQIDSLKNSMLHFFSLTNGWFLFKKAVREAYDTIKELDKAMTDIAVVSDYSLGDIWDKRQEFSKAATDMGVATVDLVEATTLYVQQGLDLDTAMSAAIETMKMGRIANLDGAEATNLMTAALRGFNMEMNETIRVNDVYSNLAAKTASDTEEIAIAMSKTASIAHSAGASFENTAAFLAQIIETTREAPETAGTALKTIIARFQELKKAVGDTVEVDGETVSVNKVEKALKSAGVALRDSKGEFRNFDEVILELSKKWDSLDIMTQRYIATISAGSRQQSRFLALMSNNERLTQLVGYAANSSGASLEQFNKTTESLQSQVNRLNNAIDIFFTNLANNTIVKGAIVIFTKFLEVINGLISPIANADNIFMQMMGSMMELVMVIGAFKVAILALTKGFDGLIANIMKATIATTGLKEAEKAEAEVTGLRALTEKSKVLSYLVGLYGKAASAVGNYVRSLINIDKAALASVKTNLQIAMQAKDFSGVLPVIGKGLNIILTGIKGLIGPVGVVVGALALLYLAVTRDGKELEALQKKGKNLKEALSQTKEAIEGVSKSSDKLTESKKTLHSLTEGTVEWKKALLEVNQQVLELIDKYPLLQKYLTNKNGELGISEKGFQALNKDLLRTADFQQTQVAKNQYDTLLKKYQMELEKTDKGMGSESVIVNKAAEQGIFKSDSKQGQKIWQEFLDKNNLLGTTVDTDTINSLIKQRMKVLEAEESKKTAYDDYVMSQAGITSDKGKKLISNYHKISKDRVEEKSGADKYSDKSKDELVNEYSKLMNTKVNTILEKLDNKELTKDDLRDALAENYDLEKSKKYVEDYQSKYNKAITQVGKDDKDTLSRLLSGKGLTDEDIKRIGNVEEYFKKLGISASDLGIDLQKLQNQFDNTKKMSANALKPLEDYNKAISGMVSELLYQAQSKKAGLSAEAKKKLVDNITGVENRSDKGEAFTKIIHDLYGQAKDSKTTKALNKLVEDLDTTNSQSVLEFANGIEKLGLNMDMTKEHFLELVEVLDKVDPKALTEKANTVSGLISDLEKRDGTNRSFTQEQYSQILENSGGQISADDFFYDGFNYQFLGDNFADVSSILREQLAIQYQIQLNTAQKQVERGEKIDKLYNDDKKKYGKDTFAQRAEKIMAGDISKESITTSDSTWLRQMGQDMNIGNMKNLSNMGIYNKIQEMLKTNYGSQGTTFSENKANYKQIQKMAGQGTLGLRGVNGMYNSTYSRIQPQEYGKGVDADSVVQAVRNGNKKIGDKQISQEDIDAAKDYDAALETVIKKNGILKSEIDATKASLKEQRGAVKDTDVELERIAVSILEANKKFQEMQQTLGSSFDNLDKLEAGSSEYVDTLNKMAKAASDFFGTNISADFVSQNLDLFRQLIDGGDEAGAALDTLREKISIDLASSLTDLNAITDDGITKAEALQNIIDTINGMNIQIGGSADFSKIHAQLSTLLGSADKADQFIKSMGYSLKSSVGMKSVSFKVPSQIKHTKSGFPFLSFKNQTFDIPEVTWTATKTGPSAPTLSHGYSGGGGRGGGGGGRGRGGGGGGHGGGGGSAKEQEPWEAKYDWLYNLVRKTNKEIRARNRLEWEYKKILELEGKQLGDALRNRELQGASLRKQLGYYQEQNVKRKQEAGQIMSKYSDLQGYASLNSEGYVQIDWNAIMALSGRSGNNEQGKRIDDYIKELEEIQSKIEATEDQLMNIEDQLYALEQLGRGDAKSLEDRVIASIVALREKAITKMQNINDSINDGNDKLLAKIQEGLTEYRNNREQDKQLKEIQKSEGKIALMKTDTSGVNQLDILSAQKDLDDARQSYTDSLIDKSIDEMTKQNSLAAEQRQYQIDLMTAQLEWDRENGTIAREAAEIMTEAIRTDNPKTMTEMLKETEIFQGMGVMSKKEWSEELNKSIEGGFSYWISNNTLGGSTKEAQEMTKRMAGKTISFKNAQGAMIKGIVNGDGSVTAQESHGKRTYTRVMQGFDGSWYQAAAGTDIAKADYVPPAPRPVTVSSSSSSTPAVTQDLIQGIAEAIWVYGSQSGWGTDPTRSRDLTARIGAAGARQVQDYINRVVQYRGAQKSWSSLPNYFKGRFKTGGLADFTGPAWLDGTKSKPEIVLNAQDTQNFLELKNIMASWKDGVKAPKGDVYYDIHMENTIDSDYDVEQMWKEMKEQIKKDAQYRNVNNVGFGRR